MLTCTKWENYAFFKQNYTIELFFAFKMACSCCFSSGGNLEFLDFLHKRFITSTTELSSSKGDRTSKKPLKWTPNTIGEDPARTWPLIGGIKFLCQNETFYVQDNTKQFTFIGTFIRQDLETRFLKPGKRIFVKFETRNSVNWLILYSLSYSKQYLSKEK